jgi:hypothetical protein
VDPGVTVTCAPLVTTPTPLLILPVPPEKNAVRVVEFPVVIVAVPAVKLVITGGATPVVTVRLAVPLTPPCVALIVAVPVPLPVATPPLTVATAVFDELQDAEAVKFC